MIVAIVVLFNPDRYQLSRVVRTASAQVDRIILIDNTPNVFSLEHYDLAQTPGIRYRPLGENRGIAQAQNVGIREALDDDCSHVLLLDQDSALSEGMVEELLRAERLLLGAGKKVAAVGPLFVDERSGARSRAVRHRYLRVNRVHIDCASDDPVESDYIISSGSLISESVLRAIGLMREDLFIDWVDVEWGLRARQQGGLACFVAPRAVLQHNLGDKTTSVFGEQKYLHSDFRNYYIVRNATFLLRLNSMGWQWKTVTALKIPQYVLFYSWHSERKLNSFMLLTRAFVHGIIGRVGPVTNE